MPQIQGQRQRGLRPFTSGQQRLWIHPDPKPTSPILDFGLTELSGIADVSPTPEGIYAPNKRFFNKWDLLGKVFQPDEIQTTDFTTTAYGAGRNDWMFLKKGLVPFTMYNTVGAEVEGASVLSDDPHTYTVKGVAYQCNVEAVTPFGEAINSRTENAESAATGTINYYGLSEAYATEFTKVGGSTFTRAVVSIEALPRGTYAEVFGVTTNVAATSPSAVIYGRTDSATYTQTNVTALSTDGLADGVVVVGNSLVLLRSTGTESHLYASLNDVRSGTSAFTAVTGGYVASKGAKAGYAQSAGNIILVGLGGYIYRLTDITSSATVMSAGTITTQNLNDVRGYNNQVLAGGASNALVLSQDGGQSWAALAAPAGQAGVAINTVEVSAPNHFYLGYADGKVFFGEYNPETGAATWTQLNLFGATPTVIGKIRFADGNRVFGYISGNDGSTGLLWKTSTAGVRFSNESPEVARFSVAYATGTTAPALAVISENEAYVGGATSGAGILALGQ